MAIAFRVAASIFELEHTKNTQRSVSRKCLEHCTEASEKHSAPRRRRLGRDESPCARMVERGATLVWLDLETEGCGPENQMN